MSAESRPDGSSEQHEGSGLFSLLASLFIAVAWLTLGILDRGAPGGVWSLPFTFAQVALISVVIWQVCDPFADAAQWVGQRFRLPGSVRGATLDAVASSMPELFSGIFFVVVAVSAAADGTSGAATQEAIVKAGAEGFGSTIATCAGSAVYNMILIPAFCALVISFSRPERPTIDIDDEVIARDGVWFLSCEILLIMFLFQHQMMWWMGVCLLAVYAVYIGQLYFDAVQFRRKQDAVNDYLTAHGPETRVREVIAAMKEQRLRVSPALVVNAQESLQASGTVSEEETDSAGVFFGYIQIPLNMATTILIVTVSTLIAAVACYFLVEATLQTARLLDVPAFFVAVILAAAASSVPDTFLAIAAARRGDDSGAVSNAFGSNIFDICICLAIPLLVNAWLTGWEPVSLL
ncbi:MAG: hypothetical protein RIK87_04250, partial [Fuerstiella sp.]